MPKNVSTTSSEGFVATAHVGEYEFDIDATGESAPDTLDNLLVAYGACFVPALRVAAKQRDLGELGEITIDITGELTDDEKLAGVAFDVTTSIELDDDDIDSLHERARDLCKVHDALRSSLQARISINGYVP